MRLSTATANDVRSARNDDNDNAPRLTASFSVVRKPPAPSLPRMVKQALDVTPVIGVMIAKLDLRRRCNSSGAYLGKKLLRPRDAAKHNRCNGRGGDGDLSTHPPDRLPRASKILNLHVVGGKVLRQDDCIGTLQRRERFAQPARGQQPVVEIVFAHQYNVEVTSQRPMLKAVVENVQLGRNFRSATSPAS